MKSLQKKGSASKLTGANNENSVPMERYLALVKENADLRNREAKHVDTVKQLKGQLSENPYRGDAAAAKVGASAFNQNCARCHGLGAVSGGIAPDLRYLPVGKEGDDYFAQKVRNGAIRNGVTYMPAFGTIFSEEAIWAIRTWLETVHTEP